MAAGWRGTHTMAMLCAAVLLVGLAQASIGDRLPEFRTCVADCIEANCNSQTPTTIPLLHRLLLWTCPSNCDYTCQHIVTQSRLRHAALHTSPVVQFHGKWPFHRFLGMQEPFSVLFSAMNLAAHLWGQGHLRAHVPERYTLRPWLVAFGWTGYAAWTASMVFHTRDFVLTEKVDYFAAGGSVLYGMYYAPILIFGLHAEARGEAWKGSVLRVWTALCLALYVAHVSYLSFWRWDYTYNMAANIAVGMVQNLMWFGYSYHWWTKTGQSWRLWPALVVVWICVAMSMELLEFVPWRFMIDAHSLWHLGTVVPTVWWYMFLVKSSQEDLQSTRLKA